MDVREGWSSTGPAGWTKPCRTAGDRGSTGRTLPARTAGPAWWFWHSTRAVALLAALCWPSLPNAGTQQVSYGYDATGRLITVQYDNGATLHYTYDVNGNITAVSSALSDAIFANGFEEASP
ncbi:MAG: RHS repeat protein [Xanthomonadales bacterium]|nr:RHS repeat protein [Xanthomonadales bacterium]